MSTELHQAVEAGNLDEVKRLLNKKKALALQTDKRGWTPLHCAAHKCTEAEARELLIYLTSCSLILKAGGDPSVATNGSCNTPLIYIAKTLPHDEESRVELIKVLDLMLEKGAVLNFRNTSGIAAIHEAAFRGGMDVMHWLVAHGADVNLKTEADETPLHYAVRGREVEAVKYLLSKKANADSTSKEGTPLQLAIAMGISGPTRKVLENYRVRKEFLFSTPPPAYVLSPLPPPVNFPPPNPLLKNASLPLPQ